MTSQTQKVNFKVGGQLYFCDIRDIELQTWWEIVEIKTEFYHGDFENNIPAGEYVKLGIDYAGTKFWYPEYIIQPIGKDIKYVATPEEKLFLQLAEKNL